MPEQGLPARWACRRTDNYTGDTVTGTARDVEDTIRGWLPEAPVEVTEALDTLTLSLRAGRPDANAAAALGLTIE